MKQLNTQWQGIFQRLDCGPADWCMCGGGSASPESASLYRVAKAAFRGGTSYLQAQSFLGCDKALLTNVFASAATDRNTNALCRRTANEQRALSAMGTRTVHPAPVPSRPTSPTPQTALSQMPSTTTTPAGFRIILDDGAFFVDLNCEHAEPVAPGFLMVRVPTPPGAPACYECLGGFQEAADGTWGAFVYVDANSATQASQVDLARGTSRIAAICDLWRQRHLAKRQVV